MTDSALLTAFFGWTTIIHFVLLLVSTLALTLGKEWVLPLHQRLLGGERADLEALYVRILGQYKILVLVFAFGPYLALKLMGF